MRQGAGAVWGAMVSLLTCEAVSGTRIRATFTYMSTYMVEATGRTRPKPTLGLFPRDSSSQAYPVFRPRTIKKTCNGEGLEPSLMLTGNAAAYLSVERVLALMKHLNSDLKPLVEGNFSDQGPLLYRNGFASGAKSTADNVKDFKGFIPRKPRSGDQNKRKRFQPQGRCPYWGTQCHMQGQRFLLGTPPPSPESPSSETSPSLQEVDPILCSLPGTCKLPTNPDKIQAVPEQHHLGTVPLSWTAWA